MQEHEPLESLKPLFVSQLKHVVVELHVRHPVNKLLQLAQEPLLSVNPLEHAHVEPLIKKFVEESHEVHAVIEVQALQPAITEQGLHVLPLRKYPI